MTEYDVLNLLPTEGLLGRRVVFSDKKEVNDDNVVDVLGKALLAHSKNKREAEYLYRYYRGRQDIHAKEKQVRPEINNKVTVNIANEIVTFKSAYFMNGPVQYVSIGGEDDISEKIKQLNDYMSAEDKESKDKEVVDWMHICGVAPRMVLPDPVGEEDGSPFCIYTLTPMEAFNVYHSGIGHKKLCGVIEQYDEDGEKMHCIYTPVKYYEVKNGIIVTNKPNPLGMVPIVEYPNNEARIGAFEVVLPILNAINNLESNRLDDVEQFVNSILVFENCEIDEEKAAALRESLGLMIKSNDNQTARVYRVDGELSQGGAQTLVDDFTDKYIEICGMPNRNGGSSTSDTGAAVTFRDGWVEADSRANDTQKMFDRAEKEMLRICLAICRNTTDLDLNIGDIKIEHNRTSLSNAQSRMQILCEGLNNDKIHPKIPWIISGMPNAEEWYRISMEHYEEEQEKLNEALKEELSNGNHSESVSVGGQGDRTAEQESD